MKLQKKYFVIDLHKLSDKLNLFEKTRKLPCDMQSVWNLLERASGKNILDSRIDNIRKKIRINIDIIREKGYYYCGLNKLQREFLIDLIKKCEARS